MKFASFFALKTHFSFQKKLFTMAVENETALRGIIARPLAIPVTKINKFKIPKSITVFKTPTCANFANCQRSGIFLEIKPAKAKPIVKIIGNPAKRNARSNGAESLEYKSVLIRIGSKKRPTTRPIAKL